jgi:acetyl-CoA carboxylase biotin carboxyl carrier protein
MTSDKPADEQDRLLAVLPTLLDQLAASGVVELEVSVGDARIYLRQRPGPAPAPAGPADARREGDRQAEEEAGLVAVTTPLTGIFYAAPAPGEPPYVEEGDEVEPGQVVGLVEAMKVFNEIHTEVGGTVVAILATTGQLVQAGQTLLKVRPHAESASG